MNKIIGIFFLNLLFFHVFCGKKDPEIRGGKNKQRWSMDKIEINDDGLSFATVELFTSQGCSSCPPADSVLSELVLEYQEKNVVFMEEHVDYWNDLIWGEGDCRGVWRDPFSDGIFTLRQFIYTNTLKTRPATPQFVINGETLIEDFTEETLRKEIDSRLSKSALVFPELALNKDKSQFEKGIISVDYSFSLKKDMTKEERKSFKPLLIIVILEKNISITPDKAENCGVESRHDNVVRVLKQVCPRELKKGNMDLKISNDVIIENCQVAAVVQNLMNYKMIGGSVGFTFQRVAH